MALGFITDLDNAFVGGCYINYHCCVERIIMNETIALKAYDKGVPLKERPLPEGFDGWIDRIVFGGKTYALRCEVIEAHPITCSKCGANVELHHGEGRCEYCGTYYTTRIMVQEGG